MAAGGVAQVLGYGLSPCAAKRGLRYQTYLKMLLHEALEAEEKKLAS